MAYTSRKSSFSPPGTVPACHVSPPSVVRTNVPPVPLAQITFALTMLNPCKLAVVFDFWGFHCPNADADTRQVRKILIFTRASVLEKRVQSMRSSFSTTNSRSFYCKIRRETQRSGKGYQ